MGTNIVFESNVSIIKKDTYPIGEEKYQTSSAWWNKGPHVPLDKQFLDTIVDPAALKKLSGICEGTNTKYYMFKPFQFWVLDKSHRCGYLHRDPCIGPILKHKSVEMKFNCVNTSCPKYKDHMPTPPDSEYLEQFDPTDDSCVDEYGYKNFIDSGVSYYKTISPNIYFDEGDFYRQITANSATDTKQKTKINLVELVSKHNPDVPENPEKHIINPTMVSSKSGNIFDYFVETKQDDIIKALPNENIFVDAGPGTGKTFTLINKLNYMVSEYGTDPESILVLCFTNAAVDVIKKRLKEFVNNGADRGLLNVDVRTFHSFSWWLIAQANELFTNKGWHKLSLQSLSYESSLDHASTLISKFSNEIMCNWSHFIVDEVQDLTNTLARFVLKIVHGCLNNNCGITVLGDACQAIYDYTTRETSSPISSDEFYNAMYNQLAGKAKFVFLKENHRQNANLISATTGLREAILSKNYENMKDSVISLFNDIDLSSETSSTLNEKKITSYSDGSVCLLLRNNGQTLKTSSDFLKRGIAHRLNITETRNNFSPWLADVFSNYTRESISFDRFEDLYDRAKEEKSAEEVWSRFQALMHTENNVLPVRELLDSISTCKLDDPIIRVHDDSQIVVSNIHRSKGREYDCVIFDSEFAKDLTTLHEKADEYKTLYVAITRPRTKLIAAPLQKRSGVKKIQFFDTENDRWGKTKNKKISYLEFNSSSDLSIENFAFLPDNMFDPVCVGDPILLKRVIDVNKVRYDIYHENTDTYLGQIGDSYINDLIAYMRLSDTELIRLPYEINDLYVSNVYSQVVDSDWLSLHPNIKAVKPNGVWKWIEIIGLGHMRYDVD